MWVLGNLYKPLFLMFGLTKKTEIICNLMKRNVKAIKEELYFI